MMRRLALLTAAVIAAMAMTSATALADDPIYPGDPFNSVTLSNSDTSQPCGTVTAPTLPATGPDPSGGCEGTISIASWTYYGQIECSGMFLNDVRFGTDGFFRVAPNTVGSTCAGTAYMEPCRTESYAQYQWWGHVVEHEDGRHIIRIAMCLYNDNNDITLYDENLVEITSGPFPGYFDGEFITSQQGAINTADWEIDSNVSID